TAKRSRPSSVKFPGIATSLHSISFFFQAEDGIRGGHVTGVQTCALPILARTVHDHRRRGAGCGGGREPFEPVDVASTLAQPERRSEERRVGKEWRSRWSRDD